MQDNEKLSNLLFKEIIVEDEYKIRSLFRQGKDFDCIVDIGANVGWFSCLARMMYPTAKMVSVEPSDVNWNKLLENTMNLNIQTVKTAIADKEGKSLYIVDNNKNHGATRAFEDSQSGGTEVRSVTIDTLFNSNKLLDYGNIFLKIDCEGGENYILKPANFGILNKCSFIAMEIHRFTKRDLLNEFVDYMKATHVMSKKDDNPRQTTIYWERR